MRMEVRDLCTATARTVLLAGGKSMNLEGWAISVLLIVGGVVVLNHLGVDVGAAIGTSLRGLEHLLGSPA